MHRRRPLGSLTRCISYARNAISIRVPQRKLLGKKGKCSGCGHVFPIVDKGLKPASPNSAQAKPNTETTEKGPWWKFGRKGKAKSKPAPTKKPVSPATPKQTPVSLQPTPAVGGVPRPVPGQPFLQVGTDYLIDGSKVKCTNCQTPLTAQQIDAVSRIRFKQLPLSNSVNFDCLGCRQKFGFPPGPTTAPLAAQPQFGRPQFGQPQFGQPQFGSPGFGGPAFPNAPMALRYQHFQCLADQVSDVQHVTQLRPATVD